jgi:hypothetical protein
MLKIFYDRLCTGYSKNIIIHRIHNINNKIENKEIVFHGTTLDNVHLILLNGFRSNYNYHNGIYTSTLPHVHALQRPIVLTKKNRGYLFGCYATINNITTNKDHKFTYNDIYNTIQIYNSKLDASIYILKDGTQLDPQILIEYSFKNCIYLQ